MSKDRLDSKPKTHNPKRQGVVPEGRHPLATCGTVLGFELENL